MNLDKEIKGLKDENEKCYEQCEGCCSSVKENVCSCRDAIILSALEQYRAIGTVEECREARERQRTIKPMFEMNFGDCESKFFCECGKGIVVRHNRGVMDNHDGPNYCSNCGSKFDWGDND